MFVSRYVIWFMIYSCAGWIFETIMCTVQSRKWDNRGFLFGPVCPIYGAGAVGITAVRSLAYHVGITSMLWWQIFLISFFGSMIMEYSTSWALEKLFHAYWWDYSNMPLNLNGRICIPAATLFGVAGIAILYKVGPWLTHLTSGISPIILEIAALIMFGLFTADLALTVSVLRDFDRRVQAIEDSLNQRMEYAVAGAGEMIVSGRERVSESRTMIADRMDQGREFVTDRMDQGREFVTDKMGQGREFVTDKMGQGREFVTDKMGQGREFVTDKMGQGREFVTDKMGQGREFVTDKMGQGREFVTDKMGQGREFVTDRMDQGREFVTDKMDQGREFVSGKMSQGKEFIVEKTGQPQDALPNLHTSELTDNGEEQKQSQPQDNGEEQKHSQPQDNGEEQKHSQPQDNGEEQKHSQPQDNGEEQKHSQPQDNGEEQKHSQPQDGGEEQKQFKPQNISGDQKPVDGHAKKLQAERGNLTIEEASSQEMDRSTGYMGHMYRYTLQRIKGFRSENNDDRHSEYKKGILERLRRPHR